MLTEILGKSFLYSTFCKKYKASYAVEARLNLTGKKDIDFLTAFS